MGTLGIGTRRMAVATLGAPMLISVVTTVVPTIHLERLPAADAAEISAVTDDSRLAARGVVFVARAGTKTDGAAYLSDAVGRGVSAVLVRPGIDVPDGPAVLVADDPARAGAQLAEVLAGSPSKALRLAAVTGTNGKTTIAFLIQQLCARAGLKCGLAGTVLVDDGATRSAAKLTTPTAWELSPLLARMVGNGCAAAAIEASSHALAQGRLAGVSPSVAVFTNLTGDHLDYHGSMEAYADAKAILFEGLDADATAIVNADDPHAERMVRDCRARVVRCAVDPVGSGGGRVRDDSDWAIAEVLDRGARGCRLHLRLPAFDATITVPLVGVHNAMNALQAAAAAIAMGVEPADAVAALESASAPPGRLEPVTPFDAPFSVLVDYAHTDDALDSVLRALRPVIPSGARLIVVFGCGGDRDRTKRPRMAAAACRHGDLVIVTSDNPRTEPPEAIIDEVMSGVPSDAAATIRREADRARAIEMAVDAAAPGDVVIIAGKGHETEQIVGSERRPFDDRLVAAAAFERRAVPR